ncbi:MAG: T9SS type A sorting domain-containing protein [Bacteroidetes bacterium]|nr:T9SS type A sorting domain-containing protein [Bacteroidota bacterium]
MKKLIFVLLVIFCAVPLNAQFKWKIVGRMLYPVSGGQLAFDLQSPSNKIYILGGYSDSLQRAVNWIQEYDVVQNTWRIVDSMKQKRQQFVADIWNSKIVYFGGTADTSTNKNTIEGWDFKTSPSVPSVLDVQNNFGRSYSTGQVVGDNLYIIGGDPSTVGATLPYIVEYNLASKQTVFTYNSLSPDPPRQHMTFIVGDNIYIFGGVTNGVMNSVQKFNISTQHLTTLPNKLSQARAGGAAVYNPISQKGFVIGGYKEPYTPLASVEQVVVNQDGSISLSDGPSLNKARTNLMAVNYKGTVAVFGGKDANKKVVPDVEILVDTTVATDVNHNNTLPTEDELYQNYPNPFNPSTTITFQLAKTASVSLDIYSVIGQHIVTLSSGEFSAGTYSIHWNGEDKFNNLVPSGIYFLQLRAGNFIQTRKMVLLK